jgi:hypothetical protein
MTTAYSSSQETEQPTADTIEHLGASVTFLAWAAATRHELQRAEPSGDATACVVVGEGPGIWLRGARNEIYNPQGVSAAIESR